jgi:hypothetical protein
MKICYNFITFDRKIIKLGSFESYEVGTHAYIIVWVKKTGSNWLFNSPNWLHGKLVATDCDRFLAVFSRSGPVFGQFTILGNRLRLRLSNLESKNQTEPDLRTLVRISDKEALPLQSPRTRRNSKHSTSEMLRYHYWLSSTDLQGNPKVRGVLRPVERVYHNSIAKTGQTKLWDPEGELWRNHTTSQEYDGKERQRPTLEQIPQLSFWNVQVRSTSPHQKNDSRPRQRQKQDPTEKTPGTGRSDLD